jgi:hypothetical protein
LEVHSTAFANVWPVVAACAWHADGMVLVSLALVLCTPSGVSCCIQVYARRDSLFLECTGCWTDHSPPPVFHPDKHKPNRELLPSIGRFKGRLTSFGYGQPVGVPLVPVVSRTIWAPRCWVLRASHALCRPEYTNWPWRCRFADDSSTDGTGLISSLNLPM